MNLIPAAPQSNIVTMSVDDRAEDVRIALHIAGAEKTIWLAVSPQSLSAGKVLAGVRVALCNEQGQAQEIKTVRPGETEARFPDLAPGRYVVRVEKSGKTWELPVKL